MIFRPCRLQRDIQMTRFVALDKKLIRWNHILHEQNLVPVMNCRTNKELFSLKANKNILEFLKPCYQFLWFKDNWGGSCRNFKNTSSVFAAKNRTSSKINPRVKRPWLSFKEQVITGVVHLLCALPPWRFQDFQTSCFWWLSRPNLISLRGAMS